MSKLITKEIIDKVQNALVSLTKNVDDYSLEEYNHDEIIFICIDSVKIIKSKDMLYLDLMEGIGKTYMREWNADVGRLLVNALKKNEYNRIFEFKTPEFKAILLRVKDEDIDEFKANGFLHIHLGDVYYTIIRVINTNEFFSQSYRMNSTIDVVEDHSNDTEDEKYSDDSEELESLSLFDE